jgi:NitT/TauT family transport system substrate-binding protein
MVRVTFGLALCGLTLLPPLAGWARAQTPVKFMLDAKIQGPAAPFLLPLDKGYFKREGLDVGYDAGNSAIEPIAKVAAGTFDMGFADINALIRYRAQNPNAEVTAVFMVYNRPPFAIIGRKSRGVGKPKDLEGKKLGAPAADAAFAQWKIFTKAAGIDASKVTIDNVGLAVREPMLAAGQVDAVTGYPFYSYVTLKDRGVPADDLVVMQMADYGLDFYGSAIIVNRKFAAEKPDAVRSFLKAFAKGLREAVRDPPAAIATVLKRDDVLKREVELERLRLAIKDNILTPEVKAAGYGAVKPARLEASIEQIAQSQDLKSKPKAADIFDSSFLPPEAERRAY